MALDTTLRGLTGTQMEVDSSNRAQVAATIGSATEIAAGIFTTNFPAGLQRTTDEPHSVFYDPFDAGAALDTTNRWQAPVSAGGGVAAATGSGNLTLGTGTTANGYSYLLSIPNFSSTTPAWIRYAHNFQAEFPVSTNGYRGFGPMAVSGTAPTTVGNAQIGSTGNAAVFEIGIDGKMYAAVYQGGVRTVVQDLSASGNNKQPVDALTHNYEIYYRPTKIYWFIDRSPTNPVPAATSTLTQSALATDTLFNGFMVIAGNTPPGSSLVLTSNATSVSDTGKNNVQLSDGTYPHRKAKITAAGAVSIENDSPDTAPGALGVAPPAATGSVLSAANANLLTGTPTVNSSIQITLAGDSSAAMTVSAISSPVAFVLLPQVSFDGGVTWTNSWFYEPTNGACYQSLLNAQVIVGASYMIHTPAACSHARVSVKSLTSGTCTVTLRSNDIAPMVFMDRNQTSVSYTAVYQLAETSSIALAAVFAAAGAKQVATIYHPATALRQVRIKRVEASITNVSAAALVGLQLIALTATTAPATGNPAITPTAHRGSAVAAEATCLALPTTAGSIGAAGIGFINAQEFNAGIEVAATGIDLNQTIVLYSDADGLNIEPLIMRPLTAEGFAVQVTNSLAGANTVKVIARITFVEE